MPHSVVAFVRGLEGPSFKAGTHYPCSRTVNMGSVYRPLEYWQVCMLALHS